MLYTSLVNYVDVCHVHRGLQSKTRPFEFVDEKTYFEIGRDVYILKQKS